MSKKKKKKKKKKSIQPVTTLMQDLQALGLAVPGTPRALGKEHVIRPHKNPDNRFSLRARTGPDDRFFVYTWKPRVSVQTIDMSREEAVALAALINKTYPLDALGGV